ncbi:MAG: DNA repair protein RadC [Candidatus Izemoplasmatales bacterium]|nr:DNA repair protein RadC [Candidatus Izemoplasmatales bacterium]MDY0139262.1 DNA repair protein RadC [Candidatus Izemoplasmatales bacterium]
MYLIKDMPKTERPRERLLNYGPESLSSYELIAILLRVGSEGQSVIELAKSLVNNINSLSDLRSMTVDELKKFKGIGKAKAITLLAAIELGKRTLTPKTEKQQITSPANVYDILKYEMSDLKQEILMVLFLDLKANLIAKKIIFKGSLNQSLIHPREVFKYAVKFSAYQIILVHNHPSGDPSPSTNDIEITKLFEEAGKLLQIRVLDHVIIGNGNYLSIIDYNKKK